MARIEGKHVLLTGGSRGIGPVIAAALAERGAHVALAARDADALAAVAGSLEGYGVRTTTVPVDLARADERTALVSTVLERFGMIDVLVNNAGVETEGAFADLPWEAIRQTVEVNLVAPMALTHMVLPHLLERGRGHVVNVSSIGAKSGAPYAATYCGTKAGMAEWARALRLELAGTGVHFSTIFPGYVTGVGMFARFGMAPPAMLGSCSPEDVAQAVVDAVEGERVEVVVNARPLRPAFALSELSPSLGDWLMHRLGVVAFQRAKVGAKQEPAGPGPV